MNMIVCRACGWMDTDIFTRHCPECGANLDYAEIVNPSEFVDNKDGTFSMPSDPDDQYAEDYMEKGSRPNL